MAVGITETASDHPLIAVVRALQAGLDGADAPAWTLSPAELAALLPVLAVVKNQIDALELTLLREADRHGVGDAVGSANTAGWWAATTRSPRPAAHRAVALAAELDDDEHRVTHDALARGEVSTAQATVILDAVRALPDDLVERSLRRDAEQHLVALAQHHDPRELRILGRRVLDVLAPEVSEEHERWVLEAEERHARETTSFAIGSDGAGSMIGRFKIPALAGAMLVRHLEALAAPRHRRALATSAPDGPPEGGPPEGGPAENGRSVSRPLRLGEAFVEYIESRPAGATPRAGGVPATVVVTMTLETLLGHGAAATLDTGERISAAEALRLACQASVVPAVLGGAGETLHLGRRRRFHSPAQRVALALRDGGCAEQHCDWPPAMCHAHHRTPWSQGGQTSLENGLLLCPRHHTLAHDARYQLKSAKNGKVTFSRRT